ncbi:ABC transporter ATP-binding protein [Aestuariirhabdus sp. Z084]|uniref:ABC transporter ATP-binding protein n=1 Tax=Aestuariirhabdus haliotis TaxID=2918751 RepID=UPI00201B380D|nr:ABC transporter ATP-binding protein [Aestuariirhabdus haliotis]MCL6414790.1 ABC transporter ATP-binding protein [Aestuariirhabdus haliotis]MCL6418722.1 ABC transporter ATP-binding protein [Aestuariirhabdus haliotis]
MSEQNLFDLECRSLNKSFGHFNAIKDLSFQIEKGSFFSILGPSGCGKTTLLRMLAGFETPDNGEILIKGRSVTKVPPNHRPVNMVFQHLALFPNMSVAENIGYGLKRRKIPAATIQEKVTQVLERIDLPTSADKAISQLSGGQKQRVAIARCLVLEPDLLLLDEPLGALDLKLREQMKLELKRMQAEFGTTFVYITHDQSEALVMSDRVAVMNAGQFEQIATPEELYHQPETPFVASFVGDSNQIEGTINSQSSQTLIVDTPIGQFTGHAPSRCENESFKENDQVMLFVRPEAMKITDQASTFDNHLDVTVDSVIFDGARSQVLVRHPQLPQPFSVAYVHGGGTPTLQVGQKLTIGWMKQALLVFSKSGNHDA